mgnify:CR=1 FL=1
MRRKQRKLSVSRETLREITSLEKAKGGLLSATSNCRNYECGTVASKCETECFSECCGYAAGGR